VAWVKHTTALSRSKSVRVSACVCVSVCVSRCVGKCVWARGGGGGRRGVGEAHHRPES